MAEDELGVVLGAAGKVGEALAFADKALAGLTALGRTDDIVQAYADRGRTLAAAHRDREAAAAFDHALAALSETEAPPAALAELRALRASVGTP
jgi:hypothetical protein